MQYLLGVDEAGRGPLAGPVAVGAVLAAVDFDFLAAFPGLNDSKKLSEKARERLFGVLEERVRAGDVRYAVEFGPAGEIDEEGIVPTINNAMKRALGSLLPDPSVGKVFLDGSLHAPVKYTQETIIGGDGSVPAIMLASVAAKVTRDRLMLELAKDYPLYGFESHKGYGTKAHYEAIRTHGLSDMHRTTFCKV